MTEITMKSDTETDYSSIEYNSEEDSDYNEDEELEQMKKQTPELYEKFIQVRQYLTEELPNITTLIETPMHLEDRARLVEMYEIFVKKADRIIVSYEELSNIKQQLYKIFETNYHKSILLGKILESSQNNYDNIIKNLTNININSE